MQEAGGQRPPKRRRSSPGAAPPTSPGPPSTPVAPAIPRSSRWRSASSATPTSSAPRARAVRLLRAHDVLLRADRHRARSTAPPTSSRPASPYPSIPTAGRPGLLRHRPIHSYHVGIYVGGGQMIHAPHTGAVVQYGSISGAFDRRPLLGTDTRATARRRRRRRAVARLPPAPLAHPDLARGPTCSTTHSPPRPLVSLLGGTAARGPLDSQAASVYATRRERPRLAGKRRGRRQRPD